MLGWLMGRRLVEEHCFDDNIILRREDSRLRGSDSERESQKYIIPLSLEYPFINDEISIHCDDQVKRETVWDKITT